MAGPFATGVAKRVILAQETTFGVNPVTGGTYLRRVSSDLTLNKDTYESQEILVSQQIEDARHGVRRPQGTFAGQISPGSFTDFWQGLMRQNFATIATMTPVTLTLAASAGTLTLSAGGLLAAGLTTETIFRITGAGSPNTAINGLNLRINALTDTVITSRDIQTIQASLTNGSLTGVTLTVPGKKVLMPATGQLYKSYTIEHFFSDISISEAFLGCRIGQTALALPPTGLATFNSQILGQDMVQNTAQQLTSPSGPSTTSALAAVNGVLSYNNVDLAIVTGLNMTIAPALEAPAVVGSNTVPWIFMGTNRVTGSFSALFLDEVIANTFINEVEVGISVYLTMGTGVGADFMRFTLPRVKAMSNQKTDGQMSLVQSFNFTALQNVGSVVNGDLTTMVIQDSSLS